MKCVEIWRNTGGEGGPDRIGHLLMAIFGTDSISGAGDPYTHAFTAAITPPSYTVEDQFATTSNHGLKAAGVRFGTLGFSFDSGQGAIDYTATGMGLLPTKVTGANSAIGTVLKLIPGWRCAITSSTFSGRVISGDFNIARELAVTHTGAQTQNPYAIDPGPMEITGTLTIAMTSLADFDAYLASLRESFTVTWSHESSPNRSLALTMTDAFFGDQPWNAQRESVVVTNTLGFRAIYNSTDAGVLSASLLNNRSTAF